MQGGKKKDKNEDKKLTDRGISKIRGRNKVWELGRENKWKKVIEKWE